jgi:hypothetical protein
VELQTLIDEYAAIGVGGYLYDEIRRTVRAVIKGRGYPTSYSPTGRWDDDAYSALAHEWIVKKLLLPSGLQHLLLSSQTLAGFRKGLEVYFTHYLISQKERTALDNLFHRADAILDRDPRFRCFATSSKAATRLWGLTSWSAPEPYERSDDDLIAAGLRITGISTIRYREDARKLSPVVSERDLAQFMESLFQDLGRLLSLAQLMTVFRYRFNLLEAEELSLDEPLGTDDEGHPMYRHGVISGGAPLDEIVIVEETARSLLRELSTRDLQVLLECAKPDATLASVASRLQCSKSTVDNVRRHAINVIRQRTESLEEARGTYARLLELLEVPDEE